MKISNYILLLLVACLALSCKKQELSGDFSLLEGKWRFLYKTEDCVLDKYGNYNNCKVTSASQLDRTYHLEFLQKGKYIVYADNKVDCKGRIHSINNLMKNDTIINMHIKARDGLLQKKNVYPLTIYGQQRDSIAIGGLPFEGSNYLVKE